MNSKKTKILWISDIHYQFNYAKNEKVEKFFTDFFQKIKEFKSEISHVVFSGDISFSADNDSYYGFSNLFFDKLSRILSKSVIYLAVPGNHDVSWESVSKMYLEKFKSDNSNFYNRSSRIINDLIKENEFEKIYKEYNSQSNKLKGAIGKRIKEAHKRIDPNLHYGYLYDDEFNLLFILINSSWLSFGEVPQKATSEDIIKNMIPEGIQKTLNNVVSINSNILVEAGNQTYAFNLITNRYGQEIKELIQKNKPFVISMAHHPPSWIHWSERFSSSYKNNTPLSNLLGWSDLHLVGHEHNAPMIGDILQSNCLMLHTGMFLDNSVESNKQGDKQIIHENYFPNNWFSVLNVENDTLTHQCFLYEHISDGDFKWEKAKEFSYIFNEDDNSISYLYPRNKLDNPTGETEIIQTSSRDYSIVIKDSPNSFNALEYINLKDSINKWEECGQIKQSDDFIYFKEKKHSHKVRFYIGTLEQFITDKQRMNDLMMYLEIVCLNPDFTSSDIYISLFDIISYKNRPNKEYKKILFEKFNQQREIRLNSFRIDFFDCVLKRNLKLFDILLNAKFTFNIIDLRESNRL